MKWFRFYSETLEDPKVQRMDFEMRWRWLEILCLANRGKPRGRLPSVDDIAYGLRIDVEQAQAIIDELLERGLLDRERGRLVPHNWEARQPSSDMDSSAERVRRYRERQRNDSNALRNGDVTGIEADAEAEADTEKRREEAEQQPRAAIFGLFEQHFGTITGQMSERLLDAEREYAWECVEHCVSAALENGARSWTYVEKILERHKREGCEDKPKRQSNRQANGLPAGYSQAPIVATQEEIDWISRRYENWQKRKQSA